MSRFKVGEIVKGQVTGVIKYGVFVSLEDDYSGLVHISEVSSKYVADLKEMFRIGDVIKVKIIDIDEDKMHAKLSIKEINPKVEVGKSKIEEAGVGFELLEESLPEWIDTKIKEIIK